MNSQQNNSKKVAVVAVHGVSAQKPFESARAIANLLLDPTTNEKANYTRFYERFFRIMVRLKNKNYAQVNDKNKERNIDLSDADAKSSTNKEKLGQKIKKWWLSCFPDERGELIRLKTNPQFMYSRWLDRSYLAISLKNKASSNKRSPVLQPITH